MTDRIDWEEIQKRIIGVYKVKKNTFHVHFKDSHRESFITSDHFKHELEVCTMYFDDTLKENDARTIKMLMDSSKNSVVHVSKYVSDYIVFKKEIDGLIDIILTSHCLNKGGIEVSFLPEVYDGLILTVMGVEWQFLSEDTIFCTVRDENCKIIDAHRLIERSWERITQYMVMV